MLSGKLNPMTMPPAKRPAEKTWRFMMRSRFEPPCGGTPVLELKTLVVKAPFCKSGERPERARPMSEMAVKLGRRGRVAGCPLRPPRTDIERPLRHVRFVPISDSASLSCGQISDPAYL